jgi:hypothetical protein
MWHLFGLFGENRKVCIIKSSIVLCLLHVLTEYRLIQKKACALLYISLRFTRRVVRVIPVGA